MTDDHDDHEAARPRSWLRGAALVLLGATTAVLSLVVAPEVTGRLGPGDVALRARPGSSGTEVQLPPVGTVSARTHRSPVVVHARLDRLDTGRLEALAGSVQAPAAVGDAVRADIEDDLPGLLGRFAVVTGTWMLAAGTLAGALAARRRWRGALAGGAGAALAAAALATATVTTADPDGFSQPRFEGPIAAAPGLLDALERHLEDFDDLRDRLGVLSEKVAELYSAGGGSSRGDQVVILHVSDLHLNPVGLSLAAQVAADFDVDAVLDTGDLTSFGHRLEADVVELIGAFDVEYLFVAGNHDSPANRAALAATDGVTVLDGTSVEIDGLRITGFADPTFTADNLLTRAERETAYEEAGPRLAAVVALEDPDLLAVHNPVLIDVVAGAVPAAAVGHRHRSDLWWADTTVVAESGSSGAGGLGTFLEAGDSRYQMQLLRFAGGRLVAVDRITFTDLDGDFTIERVLVGAADGDNEAAPADAGVRKDLPVPRPGLSTGRVDGGHP